MAVNVEIIIYFGLGHSFLSAHCIWTLHIKIDGSACLLRWALYASHDPFIIIPKE